MINPHGPWMPPRVSPAPVSAPADVAVISAIDAFGAKPPPPPPAPPEMPMPSAAVLARASA